MCESAVFNPVSDSHRSAALELLHPSDGSFGRVVMNCCLVDANLRYAFVSLEVMYEALRTLEVLGIEKKPDVRASACASAAETLRSTSSAPEDLFNALRVNGMLKCVLNDKAFAEIASRFHDNLIDAKSLLDFYYSIGGLVLVKDQTSNSDVQLRDAEKIFRSLKDLSQSDGRWRYSSNNPESSTDAAGIALEALAGVISLASSEIDHSLDIHAPKRAVNHRQQSIDSYMRRDLTQFRHLMTLTESVNESNEVANMKNDIVKLFDSIERYEDGACYFDDKIVGIYGDQGPLSASSSVVRGITALAGATSESLNLPGEKILGLAKFFLGIGVPGSAKELYHQIDALACLEKIRQVRVTTVLGSSAPALTVNLRQIFVSGSKDASVVNQKLKFDPDSAMHVLETLPTNIDIGSYVFSFEIVLEDPENKKTYVTGGRTKVPVHITGVVQVDNEEIAVLDSDLGSVEMHKKLDLSGGSAVSLYANHLQKLRLSFTLTSPSGHAFKPHQAFLSLRHESGVEHIFVVSNSGKKFEIVLDFLGLVEKFYYLSGKYDIQLTVGDSVMENSFLQPLAHMELDLPDAPEKAARPPPQSVDPYSRYGAKAEITHIFRAPEKRPPRELSLIFLGLVLLPFLGFLAGLLYLRANLKNFPRSTVPATFAIFFHLGIAAVLSLYAFFWFKNTLPSCIRVREVEICLILTTISLTDMEEFSVELSLKKKTATSWSWMLLDSSGRGSVLDLDKFALMKRVSINARDLRILDHLLSYPCAILGRERAIILNLEHIKAIITTDEVFLRNPLDENVVPVVEELRRRLPMAFGGLEGEDDPETEGRTEFPFEFRALEVALEGICSFLDSQTRELEAAAYPALDELTTQISSLNLDRVRKMKSSMTRLTSRVQKLRDEIEQLLDDDDDMADLYLSRKSSSISSGSSFSTSASDFGIGKWRPAREDSLTMGFMNMSTNNTVLTSASHLEDNVEELEMLLEAYFIQIERTMNKLSTLREYIDDTEDYINIQLDNHRNQLIQLELFLSSGTVCLCVYSLAAAIFGMNIPHPWRENHGFLFKWVVLVAVLGSGFLFLSIISYARHKGLVGS
ncbi:dolichyl-diphosphooligosaccharide--protein glycosyltransferase subunit 2-like [Dorcoceras hygrometricum]|uniref:Ribophorin II n=1 Tax=Dorcoceras hygrometricum TaxID=472368 RepID=A0A2Z7APW6_9LAMI|nr:dolichyl-diphosphooligosaccharide--protein glycosyltransferase subunit 2-like [Dorcoceras hygrometricum]